MPNTKAATKALRQSVKRRAKNRTVSNAYKTSLKEYRSLVKDGKTKEAKEQFDKVQKRLDKAAKTGVIKKNKASRLKSRANALTAKA